MRKSISIPTTIWLLAFWCVNSSAGPIEDCHTSIDHVGLRKCEESAVSLIEARVRSAEQSIFSKIDQWDQEKEFKATARLRFTDSIKTFRNYLNAACEVEAATAAGGNGASNMRLECLYQLNLDRLNFLSHQLEHFDA